ncbi:hypothetical protein LX36DRAFT_75853 [Colletotrichum falcatum]|nr:hypothetical protein LX36DRAFT_75853 [Colletotrichum falcatum]
MAVSSIILSPNLGCQACLCTTCQDRGLLHAALALFAPTRPNRYWSTDRVLVGQCGIPGNIQQWRRGIMPQAKRRCGSGMVSNTHCASQPTTTYPFVRPEMTALRPI